MAVIGRGGLPAFNTNAVAAEAGVSIQTLYAYFPDKYDILREIFRREQEQFASVLTPYLERIGDTEDWHRVVQQGLRKAAASHVSDPGLIAVRNAMISVPGLSTLTAAADDELASTLALSLRKQRSDLSARAASNAATMLVTMIGAGLVRVTSEGKVDRALLNELTATVDGAMDRILEPSAIQVG